MRETCKLPTASLRAPNRHPSSHYQSQRTPRDDTKLAVSKIRHNTTGSNKMQQNVTKTRARPRARTREATASVSSPHHRHSCTQPRHHHPPSGCLPSSTPVIPAHNHVIPAHNHVIPAKAGIHRPQTAADSTYRLELPSPIRHANRPNGTPYRLSIHDRAAIIGEHI